MSVHVVITQLQDDYIAIVYESASVFTFNILTPGKYKIKKYLVRKLNDKLDYINLYINYPIKDFMKDSKIIAKIFQNQGYITCRILKYLLKIPHYKITIDDCAKFGGNNELQPLFINIYNHYKLRNYMRYYIEK